MVPTLLIPINNFTSIKVSGTNIPKDIKEGDTVNVTGNIQITEIIKTPKGYGLISHYTDISVTRYQN